MAQKSSDKKELIQTFGAFGLELVRSSKLGDSTRYRCRLKIEPELYFKRVFELLSLFSRSVCVAKEYLLMESEVVFAHTVIIENKIRANVFKEMRRISMSVGESIEIPLGSSLYKNNPEGDATAFIPQQSGKGAYPIRGA